MVALLRRWTKNGIPCGSVSAEVDASGNSNESLFSFIYAVQIGNSLLFVIIADLEEKVLVGVLADVLEGHVAATALRTNRDAHPHVVQHGLLEVCTLVTKRGGEGRQR